MKYEIAVEKTYVIEDTLFIEAKTEAEAKREALRMANEDMVEYGSKRLSPTDIVVWRIHDGN